MKEANCPNCQELESRVADLEAENRQFRDRLTDLEVSLNVHAGNSSLPPSANTPSAPKPTAKKKSKRKQGGQPGHPEHLKELLPPEQVTQTKIIIPTHGQHVTVQV
ncbi:MAG: DUF6444 domain-containing protein [Gemmataceae bacterium]